MHDIEYILGQSSDARRVGLLHAESWQRSYRGILSDAYLDTDVVGERVAAWESRMAKSDSRRYLLLAEKEEQLIGFVCTFLDHDEKWGALIDNLHVHGDVQRGGIGRRLMQQAGAWVSEKRPGQFIYLWVYENNKKARGFYERIKGEPVEQKVEVQPDGRDASIIRYVWRNPELMQR